jgi:hypothetical protein
MCSACGFPARPGHWTDAGLVTASDRLRARFHRVAILKRVLGAYGLTAHDEGGTGGIQLSTLTGVHVLVGDLDGLWVEAARLAGRVIDPLGAEFAAPSP